MPRISQDFNYVVLFIQMTMNVQQTPTTVTQTLHVLTLLDLLLVFVILDTADQELHVQVSEI